LKILDFVILEKAAKIASVLACWGLCLHIPALLPHFLFQLYRVRLQCLSIKLLAKKSENNNRKCSFFTLQLLYCLLVGVQKLLALVHSTQAMPESF